MKWISVKDRLPEYRGPANFDDNSTVLAYYQRSDDNSNFHVVLIGGGFEPSADGITGYTHWMPLPPPPTSESAQPNAQQPQHKTAGQSCHAASPKLPTLEEAVNNVDVGVKLCSHDKYVIKQTYNYICRQLRASA